MISVVQSAVFQRACQGKFDQAQIDDLISSISRDPKAGHKFQAAGNVYRIAMEAAPGQRHEYDVYYVYHSSRQPVVLATVLKRGAKAALDKVVAALAEDVVG